MSQLATRTVGTEHAEATIRARFGCHTHSETPRVVIDGFGFHSCLCQFENPLFYTYLDLLNKLDAGILPDRGAYLDQPAQTVEALQLLSNLRSEANAAASAKQEKAASNGR